MLVKELFTPLLMAADSSIDFGEGQEAEIGGFLAKVSDTITVTIGGGTVVDEVPVTAGIYTPIPISRAKSVVVTLAGSAEGTLFA